MRKTFAKFGFIMASSLMLAACSSSTEDSVSSTVETTTVTIETSSAAETVEVDQTVTDTTEADLEVDTTVADTTVADTTEVDTTEETEEETTDVADQGQIVYDSDNVSIIVTDVYKKGDTIKYDYIFLDKNGKGLVDRNLNGLHFNGGGSRDFIQLSLLSKEDGKYGCIYFAIYDNDTFLEGDSVFVKIPDEYLEENIQRNEVYLTQYLGADDDVVINSTSQRASDKKIVVTYAFLNLKDESFVVEDPSSDGKYTLIGNTEMKTEVYADPEEIVKSDSGYSISHMFRVNGKEVVVSAVLSEDVIDKLV